RVAAAGIHHAGERVRGARTGHLRAVTATTATAANGFPAGFPAGAAASRPAPDRRCATSIPARGFRAAGLPVAGIPGGTVGYRRVGGARRGRRGRDGEGGLGPGVAGGDRSAGRDRVLRDDRRGGDPHRSVHPADGSVLSAGGSRDSTATAGV